MSYEPRDGKFILDFLSGLNLSIGVLSIETFPGMVSGTWDLQKNGQKYAALLVLKE